jgi:hypothetical protein
MKLEMIQRILDTTAGLRKDGAAYLVPDEIELAVFIGLPSEVLTVPRCARLEPSGELLTIDTHKSERFTFAVADVAGFKSTGQEKRAAGRSAGFR